MLLLAFVCCYRPCYTPFFAISNAECARFRSHFMAEFRKINVLSSIDQPTTKSKESTRKCVFNSKQVGSMRTGCHRFSRLPFTSCLEPPPETLTGTPWHYQLLSTCVFILYVSREVSSLVCVETPATLFGDNTRRRLTTDDHN